MKFAWLLALLCLNACSWVIDPENRPTRCAQDADAGSACGQGYACVKGACIATAACQESELCSDGIDNDCDGATDEFSAAAGDRCGDRVDNDCDDKVDEGHDEDNDGRTWCGDLSIPGGGPTLDCNEKNPTIFRGADELCDGADNDCDGVTDETTNNKSLCNSADQQCLGQRCVVPSCAVPEAKDKACGPGEFCNVQNGTCGPTLCNAATCSQPGQYCDQASGECRTERKNNGEPCAAHNDCKSASCVESEALRLTVESPRVCMQTCCSDEDCAIGERCFASGTGARSCLPADKVPPTPGAAALCTLDTQCAAGQSCAILLNQPVSGAIVEPRTNLTTSVCRTNGFAEKPSGEECTSASECRSKACALAAVNLFLGPTYVCSQACRTSSDCGAIADSPTNVNNRASYCRFVTTSGSGGGDYVPVCVIAGNEVGAGNLGAPCSSGNNCKDGACVGATPTSNGFCAQTCCNDPQCGSLGETRTYCRPVAFGGDHYETRCVP